MKTVPLKTVTVAGQETSYAMLIRTCVNAVDPQSGMQVEDMRRRLRVIDALDSAAKGEDSFEIEDADYEKLIECVRSMKWAIVDPALVRFTDDMFNTL